jgi:uncharacterized damage-inducible protein DinB
MSGPERYPIRSGTEKEILHDYMDWYRDEILRKVKGLSDADMKKRLVPSLTTLFGIVHHLAYVERWWFQDVFAGRTVEYPWTDENPDAEWLVEDAISSEEAVALYEAECAVNREITMAAEMDDLAKHVKYTDMPLRRIMVHMIEETARHAGHADILREQIDSTVNE